MKLIISIVIVTICLFPAIESGAEYYVEPYYQRAVTIPALEGKYWYLCTSQYPCQDSDCYTDQEVGDWLVENPYGWAILDDERGPCKKCSDPWNWAIWPYNGKDVCIFHIPCQDDYDFINYKGKDDCFRCPDNYEFNDDTLCQWVGSGPQPPSPPPTQPEGLRASDGEFSHKKTVIISWHESNWVTDYYDLERAEITPTTGPIPWRYLSKVIDESDFFTDVKYYDETAKPGRKYYYRVKACNQQHQCSGYSLSDSGYRYRPRITPSVNKLLLDK